MNKEQAARQWVDTNNLGGRSDYEKAFIAGWDAGQKQLLDEAARGFEDYQKDYWDTEVLGGHTAREWTVPAHFEMAKNYQRKAWQAAKLSSAAELAAKDAELERVKRERDEALAKPIKVAESKTESTSFPWWFIVLNNNQVRFARKGELVHAIAQSIVGPFFSRESAEVHRVIRLYEYGEGSIVWCGSGYYSRGYQQIMEVVSDDKLASGERDNNEKV